MRIPKSGTRNQVNFSADVDKEHTEKVEALQVASLLLWLLQLVSDSCNRYGDLYKMMECYP